MQHFVYSGWDRKLVEVLVDGTWHPGELRSWDQAADGSWSGMVEWTTEPGTTYLSRVPAARLRELEDPERGANRGAEHRVTTTRPASTQTRTNPT